MKILNACYSTLLLGLTTLAFTSFSGELARAATITNVDKNLQALTEAAILANSTLIQSFGLSAGKQLSFSGNFNDSEWSLDIDGKYLGRLVNISFNGLFNEILNTGTYNSTGTVGSLAWVESGSWGFTDVSSSRSLMTWDSLTQIAFSPIRPFSDRKIDELFPKNIQKSELPDGSTSILDSGLVLITETDPMTFESKIVGEAIQFSEGIIQPNEVNFEFIVELNEGNNRSLLAGNGDYQKGTISGFIETFAIPEPTSILGLLTLGTLGAASTFKRQLKTSKSSKKKLQK